jgi:putative ABC transport system substrate-binding protein
VHAQQPERVRRVGVLMPYTANDPEGQARVAAFLQGLQQSGWTVGGNLRIDIRWATAEAVRIRKDAAELAALAPDVIFANGVGSVGILLQATRAVPIVFAVVADPVGAGYVNSLARPGGNATGFSTFEYGIGGKWLEILKEIAPDVKRAAVIRDAAQSAGLGLFGAIQSAASSAGLVVTPVNVRDATDIERSVAAFARSPHGGLIVTPGSLAAFHRNLIVELAARHRFPMGLTFSTKTAAPRATSIASSRAQSPPTCRCRRRPSTNS